MLCVPRCGPGTALCMCVSFSQVFKSVCVCAPSAKTVTTGSPTKCLFLLSMDLEEERGITFSNSLRVREVRMIWIKNLPMI